jgi:DNA-binding NarL/FixJ family response regulator
VAAHPELEPVGSAADAPEAIALAERLQPDVVLLDVRMPGGTGPRTAAAIADRAPGARIVAFSAYDDRPTIVAMLDAGASSYVIKGAPNAELLAALLGA